MAGVTIRIEGLDKVMKGMRNFTEVKKKKVEEIVKEGADKIRNKAIRRVPVNEGFLKKSVQINRVKEGYEVVVDADYGPFVEFGTKNKVEVPSEFAAYAAQFKGQQISGGDMYQSILDWVRLKKIRFEAKGERRQKRMTLEQTAFIIMQSILREGIEAQPYLLPSFVEVRAEMIDELTKELRA
jgi:HK97 gp10 family phage protein